MVEESTATREGLDPVTLEPRLPAYSIAAAFGHGWTVLKRDYPVLLGSAFLLYVVWGVTDFVESSFTDDSSRDKWRFSFDLAGILVHPPFEAGLGYVALLATRLRRPGFDKAFAGLPHYLRLVAISFLTRVALIACAGVAFVAAGALFGGLGAAFGALFLDDFEPIAVTGLILATPFPLVALLWAIVRLGWAPLIVVDPLHDADGVFSSLRASWELTRGHVFSLMALGLTSVLMVAVTFSACILPGFFLGIPLFFAIWSVTYEMLRREAEALELP